MLPQEIESQIVNHSARQAFSLIFNKRMSERYELKKPQDHIHTLCTMSKD